MKYLNIYLSKYTYWWFIYTRQAWSVSDGYFTLDIAFNNHNKKKTQSIIFNKKLTNFKMRYSTLSKKKKNRKVPTHHQPF
jgi:hypothetical protein